MRHGISAESPCNNYPIVSFPFLQNFQSLYDFFQLWVLSMFFIKSLSKGVVVDRVYGKACILMLSFTLIFDRDDIHLKPSSPSVESSRKIFWVRSANRGNGDPLQPWTAYQRDRTEIYLFCNFVVESFISALLSVLHTLSLHVVEYLLEENSKSACQMILVVWYSRWIWLLLETDLVTAEFSHRSSW